MKEQKVIPEAISKGIVAKRMQQCCLAALRDGQYGHEVAHWTGKDMTWLTGPGLAGLGRNFGLQGVWSRSTFGLAHHRARWTSSKEASKKMTHRNRCL